MRFTRFLHENWPIDAGYKPVIRQPRCGKKRAKTNAMKETPHYMTGLGGVFDTRRRQARYADKILATLKSDDEVGSSAPAAPAPAKIRASIAATRRRATSHTPAPSHAPIRAPINEDEAGLPDSRRAKSLPSDALPPLPPKALMGKQARKRRAVPKSLSLPVLLPLISGKRQVLPEWAS